MNKLKAILMCALCWLAVAGARAQYVQNPSFEDGTNGWTVTGMKLADNNVFSIKEGKTFIEKWTGWGGAVGDAQLEQAISGLPAGVYTLTVAAQNIQEETPTAKQSGTWIYADDAKTTVTVRGHYTVEFVSMGGEHRIGFLAVSATGNWIACDNFRLVKAADDAEKMRPAFLKLIEQTEAYAQKAMYEADLAKLNATTANARKVYDAGGTDGIEAAAAALWQAQRDAEAAIFQYGWDNASEEAPLDVTRFVVNPSFENGWEGWTHSDMGLQSNSSFTKKEGNTYAEKWTGEGGKVGDGSVWQQVAGLSAGKYKLTAAAQNFQQNNTAAKQTGAWIVGAQSRTAVNKTGEYSVVFTNINSTVTIGFEAKGATGNWIACDNFRLYYLGYDKAELDAEMQSCIDADAALLDNKMNNTCRQALTDALELARQTLANGDTGTYPTAADALTAAVASANASTAAYKALADAIAAAEKNYNEANTGADAYRASIDKAIAVNENLESTDDDLYAQLPLLESATLLYMVSNPSGALPRVTTDERYVAGCHEVFGRLSASGVGSNQILEQGFVYSIYNPEPTVLDNRTTDYLDHNGRIYRIPMEPGTLFYIRAYAMTKGYQVGYGKVMRVSTLPQGKVTWSYDYGSDEQAQNDRIETALREASEWWSNYTSIVGFNIDGHWSPGTPTADCGYGGYCRIGTNMGQRCGTLMHEMNHGVGTGTIQELWGGDRETPLRVTVNGDWAGDRANGAIQFWENDNTVVITGAYDGGHWAIHHVGQKYEDGGGGTALWMNKYAINGAHLEPGAWAGPSNWNDTQILFIGNSIITEGFMEDGLVPVNYWGGGHCLPAYVFQNHESVKYYLTNEDTKRGRLTAYLTEQGSGALKWVEHDITTLEEDDNAAWYITFDAQKQYYMFQNVATGHYMTYNGSTMKAADKANPSVSERFHLMRRRSVNADGDLRGYWIMNPSTMKALQANTRGAVAAANQNLWDNGSAQRWCILTADEALELSVGETLRAQDQLAELISNLRKVQQTPHKGNVEGADNDAVLTAVLDDMELRAESEKEPEVLQQMYTDTRKAGMTFLRSVTPESMEEPFDLTFLITNPTLRDNSDGWSDTPTHNHGSVEYYMTTFAFSQTIAGLPKGTYKVTVQGFQRPGDASAVYDAYLGGKENVDVKLSFGNYSTKLNNISVDAQRKSLGSTENKVGSPTHYVPASMEAAGLYFDKGLYQNELVASSASESRDITIAIKGTKTADLYWTIFRNFHLYYYGAYTKDEVTPIDDILADTPDDSRQDIYTLSGQRVNRTTKGIYIINGKKVMVK